MWCVNSDPTCFTKPAILDNMTLTNQTTQLTQLTQLTSKTDQTGKTGKTGKTKSLAHCQTFKQHKPYVGRPACWLVGFVENKLFRFKFGRDGWFGLQWPG